VVFELKVGVYSIAASCGELDPKRLKSSLLCFWSCRAKDGEVDKAFYHRKVSYPKN
jgi:hypothetical protein